MTGLKHKYLVAVSESTEAEDLESLLNEKAGDGWELFMLNEVDNRMGKIQYNCIFYQYDDESTTKEGESVEITDITDFKKRMEKIYNQKDPHKEYLEIQIKINDTEKLIKQAKTKLEETESDSEKTFLNDSIQDNLILLNNLKKKLSKVSDAYRLYNRVRADKITIYLSDELIDLTEKENDDNLIAQVIKLRQEVAEKYGFIIPNLRYTDEANLEPYQYRIDIRDVPAASGFVYPKYKMFYKGQSNITRKPRNAISGIDPCYFVDIFWIPEDSTKDYWDQGLSASEVLAQHILLTARKHSIDLIDYKDMNNYIEIVQKENMDLVENLVPDVITVGDLKYIIANLVREIVPVKDMVFIFEKIMDAYTYTAEKELLLERIRVYLKRQISYSLIDETTNVYGIIIDPTLDKQLKDSVITPEHGNLYIDLTKEEQEKLILKTAKIIEAAGKRIEHCTVVCSTGLRQTMYALYEEYIPGLTVLSYEEISNEVNLEEIGTLSKRDLITPKRRK